MAMSPALLILLITLPIAYTLPAISFIRNHPNLEWTALGDSYASGVGAGTYISDSYRCLRYDEAYPIQMNGNPSLGPGHHIINNCVCSGAHTDDVEAYQFYDHDEKNKPNSQYGTRPKFGNPQFATLSVGGDDIDFPGILFNCILEINLPFNSGPPKRTCDDQRSFTWGKLKDPSLVTNISKLIQDIVKKGRSGTIGNNFRLFMTGYAEFFNEVDTACNTVTFARTANPTPDGKTHNLLTTSLRQDFNKMSRALNTAIQTAVNKNAEIGVEYVDIQSSLDGHRFCEKNANEPNPNNANLWFYHYPYNIKEDPTIIQVFDDAYKAVTQGLNNNADLNAKYPSTSSFLEAVFGAIDLTKYNSTTSNDPKADGSLDWFWGGTVGPRVKAFHPQIPLHTDIKEVILRRYEQDSKGSGSTSATAAISLGPSSTPVPASVEKLDCHGISGNAWVVSRDTAVSNIAEFCSQSLKSVEYNQGTVNDLIFTVNYPADPSKTPRDAPDCHNRFANIVVDDCDGNDVINNPHNYKYGGTYNAVDGWAYIMEPKAIHIDDDNCNISYKFFFDEVEVRGMNFPDAKLGVDGSGLLKQLQGCGDVTGWSFEVTPNDVKYQWYAHGNIIIGQRDCVGQAVESAGGSTTGNCKGSGARKA